MSISFYEDHIQTADKTQTGRKNPFPSPPLPPVIALQTLSMDGSGTSNGGDGSGTSSGGDGGWSMRPMDAEQLRECGHRMVDFIADYYKSIETFPVLSQVQARPVSTLLQILQFNYLLTQHYRLCSTMTWLTDPSTRYNPCMYSLNNSMVGVCNSHANGIC